MNFTDGNLFHIYNEGNNRQRIFFNDENYFYFLGKVRKYISPNCNLLAYCLMPNQFNFLIHANSKTVSFDKYNRNNLSEGFKYLLSSYTKAVNVRENRTGSLFRQNTKCKKVDNGLTQSLICFLYIHQIPMKEGFVNYLEEWLFSSFRDYIGFRNGTLCKKDLALKLFGLDKKDIYTTSYRNLPEKNFLNIF